MDEQGVFFGLALGIPAGVICLVMTCAIYIRASKKKHSRKANSEGQGKESYTLLPRVIALDIITCQQQQEV